MKRCPTCGRTFTNSTLTDCLNDGTPLVEDVPDTVSYYGAPLPASPEPLLPRYPEEDPLDDDDEDASADFEEEPMAATPVYPETPRFGQPPSYAAPPVMQGTPPYFAAPQTKKARVPWGVILVAALAGSGIARFALHHSPPSAPPSVDSAPSPPAVADEKMPDLFPGLKLDDTLTQTPDTALRSSLIAAVKSADAAEAKSFRTLNPAPLRSIYAGDALAVEVREMQDLKKAGTTQEGRLTAQRFKDFQVNPAHTKAQVDVAEKWSTLTRSKASGKVVHKYPPETNSQIVSLTHTGRGWVVENIQFYKL